MIDLARAAELLSESDEHSVPSVRVHIDDDAIERLLVDYGWEGRIQRLPLGNRTMWSHRRIEGEYLPERALNITLVAIATSTPHPTRNPHA